MIGRQRVLTILLLVAWLPAGTAHSDATSDAGAASARSQPPEPESSSASEALPPIDLMALAKSRRQRSRLYPLRARVSRYLTAASDAMSEDDTDEALVLLRRLNPDRLNPYERAYIYRLVGYVYYTTAEYQLAIDNFNKVLAEQALFLADEVRIRFNIVQLYAALQEWENVVGAVHTWFRYTPQPTPLSYYLLAIAHYQLKQTEPAIAAAVKAIDASPDPKESWLQLLAALYVLEQDYASATPVLEELVIRFPKEEYWSQLALIYGARENYRDSLAVQQVAYLQGFMKEDGELRRLARSYLYNNMPHEAALLLDLSLSEGSIDADAAAYELLANSWIQAREFDRSLEPLTHAAQLAEDGKLYVRLGQVHMQREEWTESVRLFRLAIDKGGLDSPGFTQLLLGISYYNDDRVGRARQSFAQARKDDKTRKQANEWIAHLESESQSS
jgi:tetratricopeptide (TPR) repeat protein